MRSLWMGLIAAGWAGLAGAQDMPPPPPGGGPGMTLPATREEATARARERFARLDRNRDGVLAADEMPQRPGGGAGQLGRLDANNDGKLSAAEFEQRALEMFDRMDTDHDGRISDAERDAWRARMRPPPRPN